MRDSISLGIFSGVIGNITKSIYSYITWRSGRNEVLYPHIASSVFYHPMLTRVKKPFIVGSLTDLITGSLLGIPLTYIMKKTGKDNYTLKGAGYGAFLWLALYGAGHNLHLYRLKTDRSHTHLSALLSHILFGIVTACTAVKLADPGTFPDDRLEDYRF